MKNLNASIVLDSFVKRIDKAINIFLFASSLAWGNLVEEKGKWDIMRYACIVILRIKLRCSYLIFYFNNM